MQFSFILDDLKNSWSYKNSLAYSDQQSFIQIIRAGIPSGLLDSLDAILDDGYYESDYWRSQKRIASIYRAQTLHTRTATSYYFRQSARGVPLAGWNATYVHFHKFVFKPIPRAFQLYEWIPSDPRGIETENNFDHLFHVNWRVSTFDLNGIGPR